MGVPILSIIWIASNFLCVYILRRRNLKVGILLRILGAILGPFAIPMACYMGDTNTSASNS